jgi:hypothetical protein
MSTMHPILGDRRNPANNPMPPPPFSWNDMDKHMDDKLKPIHEKLDSLLDLVKSSVPDGDLEGHRRAHEQWLEEREQRKKMWVDVRKDMVVWAARGLVVAILLAGWYWIQGHIK